jgi:thioredoxin-like negative regulator of GroEL
MEMTPIVDGLAVEFEGKVSIVQLDAAQAANATLQDQWGLRGHPSFVVLDEDGRATERFFGPQPDVVLRQAIEAVVSKQD